MEYQFFTTFSTAFDDLCNYNKRPFKCNKITFNKTLKIKHSNELYYVNGTKSFSRNPIYEMNDYLTPLVNNDDEFSTNENLLTIYLKCNCAATCKRSYKFKQCKNQTPKIVSNEQVHISEEQPNSLHLHPKIKYFIKPNTEINNQSILHFVANERNRMNVDENDGRFSLNQKQVSHLKQAMRKEKYLEQEENLVYKFIINNKNNVKIDKNFDPVDFCVMIFNDEIINYIKQQSK